MRTKTEPGYRIPTGGAGFKFEFGCQPWPVACDGAGVQPLTVSGPGCGYSSVAGGRWAAPAGLRRGRAAGRGAGRAGRPCQARHSHHRRSAAAAPPGQRGGVGPGSSSGTGQKHSTRSSPRSARNTTRSTRIASSVSTAKPEGQALGRRLAQRQGDLLRPLSLPLEACARGRLLGGAAVEPHRHAVTVGRR